VSDAAVVRERHVGYCLPWFARISTEQEEAICYSGDRFPLSSYCEERQQETEMLQLPLRLSHHSLCQLGDHD